MKLMTINPQETSKTQCDVCGKIEEDHMIGYYQDKEMCPKCFVAATKEPSED